MFSELKVFQENHVDLFPEGDVQTSFFRRIIEALPYPFYIIDVTNYSVLLANQVASVSGVTEGGLCHAMTHRSPEPCTGTAHPCPLSQVLKSGKSVCVEHSHVDHDGLSRIFEINGHPLFNEQGNIDKMIVVSVDITIQKQAAIELKNQNEELDRQSKLLEHKNATMQELLNQVEQSKLENARQIQSNIDKIVIPLLADLETQVENVPKSLFSLIRSILTEISSPLVDDFEKKRSLLSPREIQISQMISQGHSTKQIASLLSLSPGTIEQQRKRIRRKLGITGKKQNLTSFLSGS